MADGNDKAKAAFDTFVYYAKRYVGEYLAALNSADYIVFTAGGGENNPLIRKSILQDMENLGIIIDDEKNNSNPTEGLISADNSPIKVAVIPTNEEFIVVQAVSNKLEKDNLT
jgi:acetate kinase